MNRANGDYEIHTYINAVGEGWLCEIVGDDGSKTKRLARATFGDFRAADKWVKRTIRSLGAQPKNYSQKSLNKRHTQLEMTTVRSAKIQIAESFFEPVQ